MKPLTIILFSVSLAGCSGVVVTDCPGTVELPVEFADGFEPIEDEALLESALDEPNKGKLCQGKVYQAKKSVDITLYRAWNSTNPGSRLGDWWAFYRPDGKVAQYRHDYEICYKWSPLDKLTHCKLKEGSKVVVGTGQSAECSEYLTYPASVAQQLYIEDAAFLMYDCKDYDGEFSWAQVSD